MAIDLTDRERALAAFISALATRPMVWGQSDCVMTAANWIISQGYPDPAALYRGRYRTRLGCERILNKAGGALAIMQSGADRIGLQITDSPEPGDVGCILVVAPSLRVVEAGALFDGRLWVTMGRAGILAASVDPLRVWRVECLTQSQPQPQP